MDSFFFVIKNHDHEALLEVTEAWEKLGFHVLNDESTTVEIRGMKIQIVGVDYRDYNDKTEGIMKDVFGKIEFLDDAALRIVLLHDPTSFKCKNIKYILYTH